MTDNANDYKADARSPAKGLSLVIPVYNEEESLAELYGGAKDVLEKSYDRYEIIFVDDGSTDGSFNVLEKLSKKDKNVKVIKFIKNFGQTAAIMAGIHMAKEQFIITMDGDLQNDAKAMPELTAKIEEGYDLVCGWRRDRKDMLITRKIPSYIANKMISWFSGVRLHDYGCTLKAFRGDLIKSIHLYGEMHRFIPVLVAKEGGRITEMPVRHFPRLKGKSKYGMERIAKVLLDLFALKFLSGYATRPIHFFGYFGMMSIGLGILAGLFAAYQRYVAGLLGTNQLPLVLLSMLLILLGTQTVLIGLLAEMDIRTYYEVQQKKTYIIDRILN